LHTTSVYTHFNNKKIIIMSETSNDVLYSESVKAGRRIYYFDVKQSHNGDKFVAITESKKIVDGTIEAPRISFEKHKIFLYKEDFEKFTTALANVIGVASGKKAPSSNMTAEETYTTPDEVGDDDNPSVAFPEEGEAGFDDKSFEGDFKIDMDF